MWAWLEGNIFESGKDEFCFGCVESEVPTGHSGGMVQCKTEYVSGA